MPGWTVRRRAVTHGLFSCSPSNGFPLLNSSAEKFSSRNTFDSRSVGCMLRQFLPLSSRVRVKTQTRSGLASYHSGVRQPRPRVIADRLNRSLLALPHHLPPPSPHPSRRYSVPSTTMSAVSTTASPLNSPNVYPLIEPYHTGMLSVTSLHTL